MWMSNILHAVMSERIGERHVSACRYKYEVPEGSRQTHDGLRMRCRLIRTLGLLKKPARCWLSCLLRIRVTEIRRQLTRLPVRRRRSSRTERRSIGSNQCPLKRQAFEMRQRIALGPLVSCCHTCPAKLIPISLQSRQCCCRRSASNQLSSEWPVSPFNRQRTHTPTTRSRPYRTVYRKDKSVSASIQAINYLNGAEPVTKHRNAIKDLSVYFQRLSRSPFSPRSGEKVADRPVEGVIRWF